MEKEFIPYEQALALKELGFNEPCFATYSNVQEAGIEKGSLSYYKGSFLPVSSKMFCLAPTYSQVFRWFREKYDLHHVIHNFTALKGTDEEYLAEVGKADDTFSSCRTYEEAERKSRSFS
jgi:hypothetical protein